MKKIAIVGLGMLGNAVGLHLLDAGFEVTVFNRSKDKTIQAKEKGATVVNSPKEVAEKSDLVIIVVKDADAVKEVAFEENGIVKGKNKELIVADMSTIDPSESKNISEKFLEFGIHN